MTENQILHEESKENSISLNLNISGMTCANCALKINTKLEALPGVKKVDVVLPTESARVIFDSSEVEIEKATARILEDDGYFQVCNECGERKPLGWMLNESLCQECAQANHGVVY